MTFSFISVGVSEGYEVQKRKAPPGGGQPLYNNLDPLLYRRHKGTDTFNVTEGPSDTWTRRDRKRRRVRDKRYNKGGRQNG